MSEPMTIEQACEELNRRKWRDRDDWQINGSFVSPGDVDRFDEAVVAALESIHPKDAIAIANSLALAGQISGLQRQADCGANSPEAHLRCLVSDAPCLTCQLTSTKTGAARQIAELEQERELLPWNELVKRETTKLQAELAAAKDEIARLQAANEQQAAQLTQVRDWLEEQCDVTDGWTGKYQQLEQRHAALVRAVVAHIAGAGYVEGIGCNIAELAAAIQQGQP